MTSTNSTIAGSENTTTSATTNPINETQNPPPPSPSAPTSSNPSTSAPPQPTDRPACWPDWYTPGYFGRQARSILRSYDSHGMLRVDTHALHHVDRKHAATKVKKTKATGKKTKRKEYEEKKKAAGFVLVDGIWMKVR